MKKMNNKGFSLVELIIVIAIMAILIGVLAPQYLKYVEKSRTSADKDQLDSVYTACTTAAADPDNSPLPATPTIDTSTSWGNDVLDTLGVTGTSQLKWKSKSASGSLSVGVDSQGNYTVSIGQLTVPER